MRAIITFVLACAAVNNAFAMGPQRPVEAPPVVDPILSLDLRSVPTGSSFTVLRDFYLPAAEEKVLIGSSEQLAVYFWFKPSDQARVVNQGMTLATTEIFSQWSGLIGGDRMWSAANLGHGLMLVAIKKSGAAPTVGDLLKLIKGGMDLQLASPKPIDG